MTSTLKVSLRRHNDEVVERSSKITTIQNIYNADDNIQITKVDPTTRKSILDRSAYAKLHRSLSAGSNRHSVGGLKEKYENKTNINEDTPQDTKQDEETVTDEEESPKIKYTPADFGYSKTTKLKPPLIKPRPPPDLKKSKDENSNVVTDDVIERDIILRRSDSDESINNIAKELSNFVTMDGKPRERKRSNSFRRILSGVFSSKDRKKKEDDKTKITNENLVYNDNFMNESNFNRQRPPPQTTIISSDQQEGHEEKVKEIEKQYADLHVSRFNQIKQNFAEPKQDYVPMLKPKLKPKPSISDYISTPINRYIDTSSSASTESERPNLYRDTPPRAQETYQNVRVVNPKAASIPINSERPLPNPYQSEKASPKTIERNLNKTNTKNYPDKSNFENKLVRLDDTYGTVFDSLEYVAARNGEMKPVNSRPLLSPKSPSLEGSKLKLPPNREKLEVQPRVKSPIPLNRVSTDKLIATELLKKSRSPTPPKRNLPKNYEGNYSSEVTIREKPPISPRVPQKTFPVITPDKFTTNVQVHVPSPTQFQNSRASTPVQLRMSAALKLSPQKEDVRKSVEEYYWKELKKLKEQEDYNIYVMQMSNGYFEQPQYLRRSRSLSPSQRVGSRHLSLPPEVSAEYAQYGRLPHQSIPEEAALVVDGPARRQLNYGTNFVRNVPERRSVDSLQKPIFRRGSLTKQETYDAQQNYNKRVSFSSSRQPQQIWPTRNGFTQSPPQRRFEKRESVVDDDVFFPTDMLYDPRYYQGEPIYGNNNSVNPQYDVYANQRIENIYSQRPVLNGSRMSIDSYRGSQDLYMSRNQMGYNRPLPNVPPSDEIIYGRLPAQYPNNSRPYPPNNHLQRNPVYSSQQSMSDGIYGQKQVSVRNKFCDIYGQIHDGPPQTGVLMGQVQQRSPVKHSSVVYPQPPRQAPQSFVRGSRLTSSANDIGIRYQNSDPRISSDSFPINYDNRPLPPVPTNKKKRNLQISDTESGSDASEIQKIMQNKSKSKKRGFFGK